MQAPGTGASRPVVGKKNIALWVILSIVTCGICAIVWYINLVNDVNAICQDEKSSKGGGTVFLLTLITCGIYGWIWFLNAGKRMNAAGTKYQVDVPDRGTLYLILALLGLTVVDYILLQSVINKYAA